MEGLMNWVRQIVFFMIFMSVFYQLVPDKKYKGYLKLFASLVLILLTMNPLAELFDFQRQLDFNQDVFAYPREVEEFRIKAEQVQGQQYEDVLENYQQSRSALAENQTSVQNAYMNIMLKGYRKPELWEERLQEWIADFHDKGFVLLGIELLELGKIWEKKEPVTSQEYDLAVFAVESVLHELIEPFYPSVEAETEGIIFSVVNVPEEIEEEEVGQIFLKLAEELKLFFSQYYSMELAVCISRRHYGLEGLPQCYRDISELLEYRSWNPKEYSTSLCFSKVSLEGENGWRKQGEELLQVLERHQIKEAVARVFRVDCRDVGRVAAKRSSKQ